MFDFPVIEEYLKGKSSLKHFVCPADNSLFFFLIKEKTSEEGYECWRDCLVLERSLGVGWVKGKYRSSGFEV